MAREAAEIEGKALRVCAGAIEGLLLAHVFLELFLPLEFDPGPPQRPVRRHRAERAGAGERREMFLRNRQRSNARAVDEQKRERKRGKLSWCANLQKSQHAGDGECFGSR